MDQDLTISPGALNLIEEKVENSPKYTAQAFLNRACIAQTLRKAINERDLMRLKRFYMAKDTIIPSDKLPHGKEKFFPTTYPMVG